MCERRVVWSFVCESVCKTSERGVCVMLRVSVW